MNDFDGAFAVFAILMVLLVGSQLVWAAVQLIMVLFGLL